ncbi:MAG TPA: transporter substrate-binding domain-containing protein [Paraburkholderia sp.]|nr:transporter substrate-binding domain-containing protein [Paraburkholderia sp.]
MSKFNAVARLALGIALAAVMIPSHAASTLDSVIQSKKLRCGVMLDSPPAGFRTPDNKPDGFDVAYCQDMAKMLGATADIVETPSQDRIPALVSNRIDVLIASTTNTAQRGISVAFSQPYINYVTVVLSRKGSNIQNAASMKGHPLGGVNGTSTEQYIKRNMEEWKDSKTTYTGFASDTEAYLALQQGKVDAILVSASTANLLVKSGKFPTFVVAGNVDLNDMDSIAVKRDDYQFLNFVKLFVWNQVASGRYKELYNKYVAPGEPAPLNVKGVDY